MHTVVLSSKWHNPVHQHLPCSDQCALPTPASHNKNWEFSYLKLRLSTYLPAYIRHTEIVAFFLRHRYSTHHKQLALVWCPVLFSSMFPRYPKHIFFFVYPVQSGDGSTVYLCLQPWSQPLATITFSTHSARLRFR